MRTSAIAVLASLTVVSFASRASADGAATPTPSGPPADEKALVAAPTDPGDAPKIEKPTDGTTAAVSAGALMSTGNSYQLAATLNGAYERRFGNNSVGGGFLANYGESAPAGGSNHPTTENIQAKLRYDRFLSENTTGFLLATARSDRFQGIEFRLNLDPGFKYLFVNEPTAAFWGEVGYDFQYDVRRDDARFINNPDGTPVTPVPDKAATTHSARLFTGAKYAFNSDVTLKAGVEYLQSLANSETPFSDNPTRWRLNFDALVAAKLVGGVSLGLGFGAHYDHNPLPTKQELDTSTILSLIYSYADPAPPKPDACPPGDPNAPPPPPPPGSNPPPPPPGSRPPPPPPAANPPPPPAGSNPPPPATSNAAPPAAGVSAGGSMSIGTDK